MKMLVGVSTNRLGSLGAFGNMKKIGGWLQEGHLASGM